MTEEALFHEALAKPLAERAAFLDQACAAQPALRAAVEALLAAHEASGNLLDQPAAEDLPPPASTATYHPGIDAGAVIAGRYTLVQKIGTGGMGEVWVAKQTEPIKRRVAIKLIKTGMDSRAVIARFEQERQALALMDHPNIARVLDGGITDSSSPVTPRQPGCLGRGQPFFVMELVNGLPLTKFCDGAKLTPRERLELFVPICQAVQHAHQKGIVHRDLKPSNVLVTLYDGKPVPKIIDFGVAKATGGKLTDESLSTQFGAVVGTLEYMAPEQAGFSAIDIDTRADVYSLGVILYELLTGLRPIDGKRLRQAAMDEMIRIIREEEPSKPSTRLSTDEALASLAALRQTEPKKLMAMLRGELDWVVMKCLEKDRSRRYETVNGVARDIQRYLADEPVEARPPSAGYRLKKFVRRNKGPVVAATLVVLALVGGIIGTTWGLVAAEIARQAETDQREIALVEKAKALAAAEEERQAKAEVAEFATESRRKLWLDSAATSAIEHLGYDHVWFFRWQNGILDGWVEFDEADGPKRFPLDLSRPTIDQWAKEGKKPVAKGSHGNILLTLRQIGKSDEFDCEMNADFRLQQEGSRIGLGASYSKKGKVKLESNPILEPGIISRFGAFPINAIFFEPFDVGVDRYVNKKAVPWVNIKLVDLPI